LLNARGNTEPIELWVTPEESDDRFHRWLQPYNCTLRICTSGSSAAKLPVSARWQWLLKPWALLNSEFREVLYLDADSFPLMNTEYLFEHPAYKGTGAV
jgi:hypothetical protein